MNKVDRLIEKARPKPTIFDRLEKDNPWLGMSFDALLDMMSAEHYTAPPMGTWEWYQFNHAVTEAFCREAET